MNKNKIVFAYTEPSTRSKYLIDLLGDEFDLTITTSCEEITQVIHESFDTIEALIIDHPAGHPDIGRLFKYVEEHNSYMFTLPILILTEPSMLEDDDKYLSELVIGMIVQGESKRTVLQRIKNTIRFSNSRSFDEFSNMLKVLPSLIFVKDINGRYAFSSDVWKHINGDRQSIRGLTDFDIRKSKANAQLAHDNDMKVIQTGKGMEYVIKEDDEDGTEYFHVYKEPLKDENGKVYGIIAIINNVTNEELLKKDLRVKSITDQLTGLYNRSYFEELKEKYEKESVLPITFISADCDGLKKINDKFGHSSGDKYICFARDLLLECLPKQAFLFRMGGDEFLALIPGMRAYQANKLVKNIIKNTGKYKTPKFELKLSVGCHTISKKGTSIEGGVALSDKAMYKMKNLKRKR